uniref:ARAD1C09394p n=1 Tax=Blastobotrys adeninivorans TaxID=409370 RepID=A0A060T562_BLAAD
MIFETVSVHSQSPRTSEDPEKKDGAFTSKETQSPITTSSSSSVRDLELGPEKGYKTVTSQSDPDPNLVVFDDDDPEKPLNWPTWKKVMHTVLYSVTAFGSQYNSAAMATPLPHIVNDMHVPRVVAILGTTLFMLGIAFGPMLFAPVSEVWGRKKGVLIPQAISIAFTLGTASSQSISAVLCTRFFAGLFASSAIVSPGGVLADTWHASFRAAALVLYAYFVICGTVFAPTIGALLTNDSEHSWRWSLWFSCILNGVVLFLDAVLLSETYVPILLSRRAKRLRLETKNWAIHAKHDEWSLSARELVTIHFARPFAMLATPIVFCMACYASYVYGILYLIVTSIPDTFKTTRDWGYVVKTLPVMSMFLGVIVGGILNIWGSNRYRRIVEQNNGKCIPEERMFVMMWFGWLMPAGIFIFAWTSYESIHWVAPCVGIAFMGCGFFTIFQGCLNYLVDSFTTYAASAVAANTFGRSVFGAVFPLFAHRLFENLGVQWGGSLIGFIGLGMIPIPWVFYYFGKSIRARNPYLKLVT